jgi:hypothetical protein
MSTRAIAALLPLALISAPALAQLPGQTFEVHADSGVVTVGDTVTLRLRLRMDDRDLLFDTIPLPTSFQLPGARLLSVGRLVRDKDRIYLGQAQVAFYRTGRQAAPTFTITFMRAVKGVQRGILVSDTAWVDVAPVLPAGPQPLKDIRPLEESPAPRWPWLALPVAVGLALLLHRRKGRRRPGPVPAAPGPSAVKRDALRLALDRLSAIEEARWPSQGEVARHYEEVANVVRDFMAESERISAREQTTAELLAALALHHSPEPALGRCHRVLAEADLVKFAATRPGVEAAREYLAAARELLEHWPARVNGTGDAPR